MMEAVSTSETSVNFYQTARRNIPEDSHLHTRRRENLKSHQLRRYQTMLICQSALTRDRTRSVGFVARLVACWAIISLPFVSSCTGHVYASHEPVLHIMVISE
jgi:hypothetical protein